jgi:ribosome-associated protein
MGLGPALLTSQGASAYQIRTHRPAAIPRLSLKAGVTTTWGDSLIRITHSLSVDDRELRFTFARSPGPGGQNVNKVATTAILWFDLEGSPSLTQEQKTQLRLALGRRISKDGVLQVEARRRRTQAANRQEALERFRLLLTEALRPRRPRKKTRPTAASRERRLIGKALRSRRKAERRGGGRDEGY